MAYVLWHWPPPRTSQTSYDGKLVAFHESLAANAPEGLMDVLSFRVKGLPWVKPRSQCREDWYLVSDFEALGALNEAAVAAPNRESHDEVARASAGLAAGLYRLREGQPRLRSARFATWIRKPARTAYQAFFDHIADLVGDLSTDLWQRQMVLGPTPEFCVHSERRLDLPSAFRPTAARVQLVTMNGDRSASTTVRRLAS